MTTTENLHLLVTSPMSAPVWKAAVTINVVTPEECVGLVAL